MQSKSFVRALHEIPSANTLIKNSHYLKRYIARNTNKMTAK